MNTPDLRCERAHVALEAYRTRAWSASDKRPKAEPDDLIDLLTDLRHLCARRGWDITEAWAWSDMHFTQEQQADASPRDE